jgi:hypothetical protein
MITNPVTLVLRMPLIFGRHMECMDDVLIVCVGLLTVAIIISVMWSGSLVRTIIRDNTILNDVPNDISRGTNANTQVIHASPLTLHLELRR